MYIYDWFIHTFKHSLCTQAQIAYNGAFPLPSFLPLLVPFVPLASLFNPLLLTVLGTLLAVTGSVHLGLRLLVNWPPLTLPLQTLPFQIPRTRITQRLTRTTSRWIRRLLSGTGTSLTTGSKYLEYNPGSESNFFLLNDKQQINEKQKNWMRTKVKQNMNGKVKQRTK
jgi:hypothetical protein